MMNRMTTANIANLSMYFRYGLSELIVILFRCLVLLLSLADYLFHRKSNLAISIPLVSRVDFITYTEVQIF